MNVKLESHYYVSSVWKTRSTYICIIYILSISANCNLPFQCQKVDNIQQLDSWYQLCCGAIRIGRHLLQDPEED